MRIESITMSEYVRSSLLGKLPGSWLFSAARQRTALSPERVNRESRGKKALESGLKKRT